MKCNVGRIDKTIRWIAGIVVIAIGIYFQSWWGLIGVVFIITAITGFCILYLPFGINTCPPKK